METTERKTINFGELLADYVTELEYGTIIHYQDIERITQEKYGTSRYYRFIAIAKRIAEGRGKMFKSIGGKDYQVLFPGDYTDAYAREIRLAKKRVKHGGKIIKGAPVNDMSIEERKVFNNVSDFHARLEASTRGSYVEVQTLTRKTHPLLAATNMQ